MSQVKEDQESVSLSIVSMTWNRSGPRLRNLLNSLLVFQNLKPLEFIVVDTSTDSKSLSQSKSIVAQFPAARLIHFTQSSFNKCQALNVGIRATNPDVECIACVDVDFIFSPNLVQAAMTRLESDTQNSFVMVEARRLPKTLDLAKFGGDTDELQELGLRPWGPSRGRGSFQAAPRNWWFKVHGFDENFKGGLGGMDTDMAFRAEHDPEIQVTWIKFAEAQAYHQWHSYSKLRKVTEHLTRRHPDIVKNEDGWGQIPKDK